MDGKRVTEDPKVQREMRRSSSSTESDRLPPAKGTSDARMKKARTSPWAAIAHSVRGGRGNKEVEPRSDV